MVELLKKFQSLKVIVYRFSYFLQVLISFCINTSHSISTHLLAVVFETKFCCCWTMFLRPKMFRKLLRFQKKTSNQINMIKFKQLSRNNPRTSFKTNGIFLVFQLLRNCYLLFFKQSSVDGEQFLHNLKLIREFSEIRKKLVYI